MVNRTKFGTHFWLMNENCPSKLVSAKKHHFCLTVKMVTNQK
jgi:hypothetical protein